MNKRVVMLLLLVGLMGVEGGAQVLHLTVTNEEALERRSELVAVQWRDIQKNFPTLDRGQVFLTALPDSAEVITQGTGDELLFMADFAAGESRRFLVRESPGAGRPKRIVDGRLVLPREDYAWENDRIAFRMYGSPLAGDVKNGIDVWTKRVRSLIVEKWYRESEGSPPGKDTYHVDRGEGADFFHVGKSLGAGGVAIRRNGRLHQPGVFKTWRTIANGPLRVSFELSYDSIDVDGTLYSEIRRTTLDAGQNLNRIDVTYYGPVDGEELEVACGLVKRPNITVTRSQHECWLSLWGETNADTTNGFLGTGVVLPESGCKEIVEDTLHCLILGKARTGRPITYYAGAGWTRSGDFGSVEDWNRYLAEFARKLGSPLRVELEVTDK
ncbi:MAG: DUF4861 family protein [Bacteroidota bacterium]